MKKNFGKKDINYKHNISDLYLKKSEYKAFILDLEFKNLKYEDKIIDNQKDIDDLNIKLNIVEKEEKRKLKIESCGIFTIYFAIIFLLLLNSSLFFTFVLVITLIATPYILFFCSYSKYDKDEKKCKTNSIYEIENKINKKSKKIELIQNKINDNLRDIELIRPVINEVGIEIKKLETKIIITGNKQNYKQNYKQILNEYYEKEYTNPYDKNDNKKIDNGFQYKLKK